MACNHYAKQTDQSNIFDAVCIFEPLNDDRNFLSYSESKVEYARQLAAIQAGLKAAGISSIHEYEEAIGRMIAHVRNSFPAQAVSLNTIAVPGNGTVVATIEAWSAGKVYGTYDRKNPTWEYQLKLDGKVFCDGTKKD